MTHNCLVCNAEFKQKRKTQLYCSRECRVKAASITKKLIRYERFIGVIKPGQKI